MKMIIMLVYQNVYHKEKRKFICKKGSLIYCTDYFNLMYSAEFCIKYGTLEYMQQNKKKAFSIINKIRFNLFMHFVLDTAISIMPRCNLGFNMETGFYDVYQLKKTIFVVRMHLEYCQIS